MAKHAIDYNMFGGPQRFEKWMDVHSAPSCPFEVIKMSTSTVCRGLHVDVAEANAVRALFLLMLLVFVHRRGHQWSI